MYLCINCFMAGKYSFACLGCVVRCLPAPELKAHSAPDFRQTLYKSTNESVPTAGG